MYEGAWMVQHSLTVGFLLILVRMDKHILLHVYYANRLMRTVDYVLTAGQIRMMHLSPHLSPNLFPHLFLHLSPQSLVRIIHRCLMMGMVIQKVGVHRA